MRIPLWSFLLAIVVIIIVLLLITRFRRSRHTQHKIQEKTLTAEADTRSRVSLQEVDKLIVPQYNWHINMDKPMYLTQDSMYEEVAWTKNRLVFLGTSLEKLIPRLERWYNVKITVRNDALRNQRFTAVLADPGLPKVLEAMQNITAFHYQIDKNQVTITP